MRNYMQEMMDVMLREGAQATYDLGPQLLGEIEAEQERLNNQAAAIRAFGKILEDTEGVIARSTNLDPNLDPIEASERPREIVSAAIEVWDSQQDGWRSDSDAALIRTQDVLERLRTKGLELDVKQPLAVIGTVLASAEGFRKVARNTFEYAPQPPIIKIGDVPW
ncbi:MAG: hypothetical protein F4W93_10955 [Dehalococcoidia bacterium]|nr:hypothetical protein [Dehalococcoidia bacterium]